LLAAALLTTGVAVAAGVNPFAGLAAAKPPADTTRRLTTDTATTFEDVPTGSRSSGKDCGIEDVVRCQSISRTGCRIAPKRDACVRDTNSRLRNSRRQLAGRRVVRGGA
jgi:hypothetical protein